MGFPPMKHYTLCWAHTNRIPMLIDAPSGYITTEKMPVNHYLVKPMQEYVTSR